MTDDYYPEQDAGVEDFDLSHLSDAYREAVVEPREYDDIPDGKYQVRVEKAELVRSQTSGKFMLKWTLRILGPKCAGRYLWRNSVLAQENIKWLKTDLETCGIVLADITELRSRLKDIVGLALEVNKRTKGDSESIYINKRIVLADSERAIEDSALAPF